MIKEEIPPKIITIQNAVTEILPKARRSIFIIKTIIRNIERILIILCI